MSNGSHRDTKFANEKFHDGADSPVPEKRAGRSLRSIIVLASVGLVCVLALTLGLGLGLGLKHHHNASPSTSANSSSPSPPSPSLAPLQSTPQNNFVLAGLSGQPPQTRMFNFTVSMVQGAPDGVSKPMLVVNGQFVRVFDAAHNLLTHFKGMYPGPTIEANQGDRLVVNVTNMLENRT